MLKKLRSKKTAKKIWIFLAILIVPAFILWGSGSLIRSKQESKFTGKIFGRSVSSLEFNDALSAVKNQAVIQFGDNLAQMQKYLNLESQAWERLILLAQAKRHKINVSDKEVIELIQSYPFFQKNGRFDQRVYSSMLDYVFHTPGRIFEEQTRQNLVLSKLYKEITDSVTLADEEIKEEYRKNNERISIYYIAGLYSEFAKDITATEQDIKDYFINNALQFKQPLSFNLEYVSLPLEDNDEKAIKDKIKNFLSRLNKSRTFLLPEIFYSKKVRDKKEDFIKVAKDFNLTAKETGLFRQTDSIPGGIGWSPEILGLISKAKTGQSLPPIYMDKYCYIIRLKERKEPYIPDFVTIKDKVKEALIKDKSRQIAQAKIEDCLKKLKENPKSLDFDKWAKEYGLKSGSTDLFKYGSYIEGVGASDNFWIAAHNLKENEFSGIIDVPSGPYIIKLKNRESFDEKKFASEKDAFVNELLLRKKREYFLKFLEELKKKAGVSGLT